MIVQPDTVVRWHRQWLRRQDVALDTDTSGAAHNGCDWMSAIGVDIVSASYEAGRCQAPDVPRSLRTHYHRGRRAGPPQQQGPRRRPGITSDASAFAVDRSPELVASWSRSRWLLRTSYPCRCHAPITRDFIREA